MRKVVADVGIFRCLDVNGRLFAWGSERNRFAKEPAEYTAFDSEYA